METHADIVDLSFRHFPKNETTGWGRSYSYDNDKKRDGFVVGFKACQQLYDNMFSLDFLCWIDEEEVPRKDGQWVKYFNKKDNYFTTKELYNYWQSLQKHKVK